MLAKIAEAQRKGEVSSERAAALGYGGERGSAAQRVCSFLIDDGTALS
jgi:hypothetical protein